MPLTGGLFAIIMLVTWLGNCFKILREYERGVVFRLGRLMPEPFGPGLPGGVVRYCFWLHRLPPSVRSIGYPGGPAKPETGRAAGLKIGKICQKSIFLVNPRSRGKGMVP